MSREEIIRKVVRGGDDLIVSTTGKASGNCLRSEALPGPGRDFSPWVPWGTPIALGLALNCPSAGCGSWTGTGRPDAFGGHGAAGEQCPENVVHVVINGAHESVGACPRWRAALTCCIAGPGYPAARRTALMLCPKPRGGPGERPVLVEAKCAIGARRPGPAQCHRYGQQAGFHGKHQVPSIEAPGKTTQKPRSWFDGAFP